VIERKNDSFIPIEKSIDEEEACGWKKMKMIELVEKECAAPRARRRICSQPRGDHLIFSEVEGRRIVGI
jgi:hypothetical protein